jgi:hypothetical protein
MFLPFIISSYLSCSYLLISTSFPFMRWLYCLSMSILGQRGAIGYNQRKIFSAMTQRTGFYEAALFPSAIPRL